MSPLIICSLDHFDQLDLMSWKLQMNSYNLRIRKEYYSQRIIKDWNSIAHTPDVYLKIKIGYNLE